MQNLRPYLPSSEPEAAFNQDPWVIQMHTDMLVSLQFQIWNSL